MQFDYFYPEESENYVFYRTPKVLCTDKRFRGLSSDAKILYGILLDRIQLSKKNRWIDEEGHVYVYMTIESIEQALGRCHQKSCKVLKELVNFGLVEQKKQGLPFPFQTSDQNIELEVKSRMQAIDFYCKKCRKSMRISYALTGDRTAPAMNGIMIKCHTHKCTRVVTLKNFTEGQILERTDALGKCYL